MKKNKDVCFSRNTDDWRTPSDLYDLFMNRGFVDCFPFQSTYNELDNLYFDKKLFINPPFSKLNAITEWLIKNIAFNSVAVLIPSRTDTKYFHALMSLCPVVVFIKGRLRFNDSDSAPFPSILLLFNFYNISNSYLCMDHNSLKRLIATL